MRSTRRTPAVLIALAIGGGIILGRLYVLVMVRIDGYAPRVGWTAALTLLLAAVTVGLFAHHTWQALHKRRQRMTSEHGVRMLALAKSCIAVGSLFGGGYAGFALAFIGALDTPLGRERVLHAGAAAVAGILLLVAAILLERACVLPTDDDNDSPASNPTPA